MCPISYLWFVYFQSLQWILHCSQPPYLVIEKFVESLLFIKVIWCMLYFLVVFQFTYRWCTKFTFITFLDMFVSSHPEWCDRYRGSDKTEKGSQMLSLYRFLVRAGTRALIKHGEIGDDSKAAPEKLNHQPFAKKWPKCPKCPNFGYL